MHVTNIGLMVKILCSIGGTTCLVSDLSIKVSFTLKNI